MLYIIIRTTISHADNTAQESSNDCRVMKEQLLSAFDDLQSAFSPAFTPSCYFAAFAITRSVALDWIQLAQGRALWRATAKHSHETSYSIKDSEFN
jgi:hypothetical protein